MAKGKPIHPLDPLFLIEHAERLTTSEGGGRPPTIDSRCAASAAYYSAYHAATRESLSPSSAIAGCLACVGSLIVR